MPAGCWHLPASRWNESCIVLAWTRPVRHEFVPAPVADGQLINIYNFFLLRLSTFRKICR